MIINILKIRNAPGEKISFHVSEQIDSVAVSGQRFSFVGAVEVSGEVINQNNQFLVKGQTRAVVSSDCVSCLEPVQLTIQGTIDEIYGKSNGHQDPDGEIIGFDGDVLNIEPEVIKSLLMEIPMRVVCSPDCRGLCQGCGCNLNIKQCDCENETIDPRLAILKKLQQ
ncbi:protein of unknown function DUF177 [Desulforamulus reducens MI-1]|uniref:DUF177 domain-containing protein n=1 Tax=Desulforamulus reducens (strain ATCC BAA-1160 / DSM 100696 / MI-1) TaxID=349161 RepID=A4J693_DESRM|nr:DUF177 domain-containing protein [Desulforamulus reducens]ABO50596.1 protein of unknown function DUF177 [Desulforamulus reducens MI-1]